MRESRPKHGANRGANMARRIINALDSKCCASDQGYVQDSRNQRPVPERERVPWHTPPDSNWMSYRFSSSSSRRARSRFVAIISRRRTKARMISMLTRTARGLRKTLESIATPCSVKALGSVRVPPHLDLPNWNLKSLNSASVNRSMKSSGKRSRFRLTALFKLPVVTP